MFSKTRSARLAAAVATVAIALSSAASPAFAASSNSSSRNDSRLDPAVANAVDHGHETDVFVTISPESSRDNGAATASDVSTHLRARKSAVLAGADAPVVREYDQLPVTQVHVRNRHQLDALLAKSDVTGIFMPRSSSLDGGTQSDPAALNMIHQPAAVAAGYRGNGTYVAVLDTGADYRQPAFGSCTAPNTPSSTCRVAYSRDFAPDDGSLDDDGHGTNVSRIVANVAPGTKILAMDVFNRHSAFDADILSALNTVASYKRGGRDIVAVNMSLGYWYTWLTGSCTTTYTSVFSDLVRMGVTPVVAAGNTAYQYGSFHNGVGTPACDPSALPVGAVYDASYSGGVQYLGGAPGQCTDNTMIVDHPTCFSQTGPNLGLWAPGSFINAAGVVESGTSQATPHVAGAVALLAGARPYATAGEIRSALMNSGPSIADSRAPGNAVRHRLDVMLALNTLFGMNLAPSVSSVYEQPRTNAVIGSNWVPFNVSWKASDPQGIKTSAVWLQVNGGAWSPITLSSPTATSFNFSALMGSHYRVAVQSQDNTGIWSNLVYGRTFTPTLSQQNAAGVLYSSGWKTQTSTAALGGSLAYTSVTNASVKFTASGSGIAWIGTKSAPHGVANVYVDGRFVKAVDTYASTTVLGKVLFEVRFGGTGTHSVTIVDAGTAGRPYVDADAFVVTK